MIADLILGAIGGLVLFFAAVVWFGRHWILQAMVRAAVRRLRTSRSECTEHTIRRWRRALIGWRWEVWSWESVLLESGYCWSCSAAAWTATTRGGMRDFQARRRALAESFHAVRCADA